MVTVQKTKASALTKALTSDTLTKSNGWRIFQLAVQCAIDAPLLNECFNLLFNNELLTLYFVRSYAIFIDNSGFVQSCDTRV
jgi:hypothetical protein